ncbi:hypothetical protein TNCT_605551 [Trichonephila clavata]|uniref:Uncharacterized protein n=1 Tax=Trichonephila clavata TaxID=2740835 RepID=A0A8X6GAJ3_TRICU|nr:hypothetical protein TNCT_605551 [Trichonephila clavata]
MGGLNHHNWFAGLDSKKFLGKNCYWQLFKRSLDVAMIDAWKIHKTVNKNEALNLKEFRRALTIVYLKKTALRTRGRPRILTVSFCAKEDIRKDISGRSFVQKRGKQHRCQREPKENQRHIVANVT